MSGLAWPVPLATCPVTQKFDGTNVAEREGYLYFDAEGPWKAKVNTLDFPGIPAVTKLAGRLAARFPGASYRADLHGALDQACPKGTNIVAPEAGKLVVAGTYSSTGEHYAMLRIHRDPQTILFFTHLRADSLLVPVGTHLTRGQHFAESGNSGLSTGPHLHWEVRVGAATDDPHTSDRWVKYNPGRLMAGHDKADAPFIVPS